MLSPAQQTRQLLEEANTIAIFGHEHIDGDCLGSMLGLGGILEKMGKKVSYYTPYAVEKTLQFMTGREKIQTTFDFGTYDLLLCVDFSPFSRIKMFYEQNPAYFQNAKAVIIDHHIGDNEYAFLHLKDAEATSCCEWIFEHVRVRRNDLIDPQIATYLYLGLTTDSGNFFYDKDSVRTLGNALDLVKRGADKKSIIFHLFRQRSYAALQFMQLVLSRMKIENGVVSSYYEREEARARGLDKEEADYAMVWMQSIKEIHVAVLLRTFGDIIKGSMRAKDIVGEIRSDDVVDINVATIAKDCFGGGGHKKAAGFSVPLTGDFVQQKDEIVAKIVKSI